MSTNPFAFKKPITLDTLDELFAHHNRLTGGWSMTAGPAENEPPARPEDITEDEWEALGDPGKQVIARERAARQTAERALAASRARPTPPRNTPTAAPAPAPAAPAPDPVDIAAIVQQAVEAAVKPFQERDEQRQQADQKRQADEAAKTIADAVTAAAGDRLHDPADALSNIDLTKVTDGNGGPDADKIKTQLDQLLTKKPYLGKTGTPRVAPPGVGTSPASGGGQTTEDLVQASLARMQKAAGIRAPQSSTS